MQSQCSQVEGQALLVSTDTPDFEAEIDGIRSDLELPEASHLSQDETHAATLKSDTPELMTSANFCKMSQGDLIKINYYGIPHRMVVYSIEHSVEGNPENVLIRAIHYGRQGLTRRIVREDFNFTWKKTASGDASPLKPKCWLVRLPKEWCYPAEYVVQRACSRLNESQYSIFGNKSKDFTMWSKTMCTSHRPECVVPIYVTDRHEIYKVKVGDHVNFNCQRIPMHGEVTNISELGQSKSLLTVISAAVDSRTQSIEIVHEQQTIIPRSDFVKVVISAPKRVEFSELSYRIQQINNRVFDKRGIPTSYEFCVHLTNPNRLGGDWIETAQDLPQVRDSRVLYRSTKAEEIESGDIIFLHGHYQVVVGVHLTESPETALVCTVLYGPKCVKYKQVEAKIVIEKKEKNASLCVHNEAELDCPLYGGGRNKPDYTVVRVEDQTQIEVGCVISMRNENKLYNHNVVCKLLENDECDAQAEDDGKNATCTEKLSTNSKGAPSERIKPEATGLLSSSKMLTFSSISYDFRFSNLLCAPSINEKTVSIDLSKQKVFKVSYNVQSKSNYSNEEVVQRARSRLGERQHNLQWNSGRDFARWCSIKHQSNREQCCVPINSAGELLQFQRGHIKFLKRPRFIYTHDVILRDCNKVEGCEDVLKVRIYENNAVFKRVRIEKLRIDDAEELKRVRYTNCKEWKQDDFEPLLNCTFLNADDDRYGYTGKGGSKVSSQDFCFWSKTCWPNDGVKGVRKLLRNELEALGDDIKSQTLEDIVGGRSLGSFDHIVLTRKVNGIDAQVHFVLTEWDAESCTGFGVTYELPTEKVKMGYHEFNGFLRVAGPGQIEKVVHNSELNWDLIDAKFRELRGVQEYSPRKRNCEHLVNYLVYGRCTSLQLGKVAGWSTNYGLRILRSILVHLGRFLRTFGVSLGDVISVVPDGGTLLLESFGLSFVFVVIIASICCLLKRRAYLAMPGHELGQRLANILSMGGSALTGAVATILVVHLLGLSCWPALGASLGIGSIAVVLGFLLPKLWALLKLFWKP